MSKNTAFSIDLRQRFYGLVPKVFNQDGSIKPHTKEARKQLISVCFQIDRTGTYYGNVRTGELNLAAVRNLIYALR